MTDEVRARYRDNEGAIRADFAKITLEQLLDALDFESMGQSLHTKAQNKLREAFRINAVTSREPLKSVADLAALSDASLQIYRHIARSSMLVHIDNALVRLVPKT